MALDKEKKQQIEECKDKDGKIIDIPPYIMKMTQEKADEYFEKNKTDNSRMLSDYSPDERNHIREHSTHLNTSDERLQIRKDILLDMIKGKSPAGEDGRQKQYLIVGPANAGKTTTRALLDSDEKIDNPELEAIHEQYKKDTKPEHTASFKFGEMRKKIPEFKDADKKFEKDMYGLIRSEVSGLHQAFEEFAKDVGLTIVGEQLMDIDVRKSDEINNKVQNSDLTVIATTASPEKLLERNQKRKDRGENTMSDSELTSTIKGCSAPHANEELLKMAKKGILLDTNQEKSQTILTANEGEVQVHNSRALIKFRKNEDYGKSQNYTELVQRSSGGRDLNVEHLYGR